MSRPAQVERLAMVIAAVRHTQRVRDAARRVVSRARRRLRALSFLRLAAVGCVLDRRPASGQQPVLQRTGGIGGRSAAARPRFREDRVGRCRSRHSYPRPGRSAARHQRDRPGVWPLRCRGMPAEGLRRRNAAAGFHRHAHEHPRLAWVGRGESRRRHRRPAVDGKDHRQGRREDPRAASTAPVVWRHPV